MSIPVFQQGGVFQPNVFQHTGSPITPPPPPPTITGFSPISGDELSAVTILGTNFTGVTSVAFGGIPAVTYTVVSVSQINATVPTGAITGVISVTTTAGTAFSSGTFTVTTPPPPPPPPPPITNIVGNLGYAGPGVFMFGGSYPLVIGPPPPPDGVMDTTIIICDYRPIFYPDNVYAALEITNSWGLERSNIYAPLSENAISAPFEITGEYQRDFDTNAIYSIFQITGEYDRDVPVNTLYFIPELISTYDSIAKFSEFEVDISLSCNPDSVNLTITYDTDFEEAGTV